MIAADLRAWVSDALERSLALVADLDEAQLMGPYLPTVNPLRWEIGHAAWFYSRWVLRHGRNQAPVRADEDALFDSIAIAHTRRWELPLPALAATVDYVRKVHERVAAGLDSDGPEQRYLTAYAVFHEDMHGEAFTYARQTLGYPAPALPASAPPPAEPAAGDVEIPGGWFRLGAEPDAPFVFDNEKWAHEVRVEPFAIARTPVTQGQFSAFVDDGGYQRPELWGEAWGWRQAMAAEHPRTWRRRDGVWTRRHFDRWVPLEPDLPIIHVSWYEARAYCRWAGRRLPTELEWEVAAAGEPDGHGNLAAKKRRYPWGDEAPGPEHGNLDNRAGGCVPVGCFPAGDSAFGCRQMLGNVWEWTASDFRAYPGFVPDMYTEYSEPWFSGHKVLRGGAYPTRSRLIRPTWRNFYTPHRDDVLAGFRTCAP